MKYIYLNVQTDTTFSSATTFSTTFFTPKTPFCLVFVEIFGAFRMFGLWTQTTLQERKVESEQ